MSNKAKIAIRGTHAGGNRSLIIHDFCAFLWHRFRMGNSFSSPSPGGAPRGVFRPQAAPADPCVSRGFRQERKIMKTDNPLSPSRRNRNQDTGLPFGICTNPELLSTIRRGRIKMSVKNIAKTDPKVFPNPVKSEKISFGVFSKKKPAEIMRPIETMKTGK